MRDVWDERWLAGLERVVVALFLLTVIAVLVWRAGWRPDWWSEAGQACGLAFFLTFLLYLNVGGSDRLVRSNVGAASLALLGLSWLINLPDAMFEIDLPILDMVGNAATVGFSVCFAAYLVMRYRHRRQDRITHDSDR